MFIRWAMGCNYGKLVHVGRDFIEIEMVDVDTMTPNGTVMINSQLIFEVSVGTSDIMRVVAEVCMKQEG
jgi:hypothetical protein